MNRKWQITTMAIAALLFVFLMLLVKADMPPGFDVNTLAFFAEHYSPLGARLFQTITWVGSILFLAPTGLLIGYWLYRRKRRVEARFLIASLTLAALAARLLKYLIGRERPDAYPALVDTYTDLAFPSVHAAQVTAFCLALFLVLGLRGAGQRVLVGLVLLGLALGVTGSRLYLQVHYPSDVIGGALLAVVCVVGCALLFP